MTDANKPVSPTDFTRISRVAPFWITLLLVPFIYLGAFRGGWTVILLPFVSWYLCSALDAVLGPEKSNADPDTPQKDLFWYRAVTLIWTPIQFFVLFSLIWYVPQADHLGTLEQLGLFFGVGVITGTVGINYSHELMHQKNKFERHMADLLLSMVLYSHFRSEHLLVHHRYVGTPKDAVTARYNESFYQFFPRVLKQSLQSAFQAENAMLARRNLPWHDLKNPFYKYAALQIFMLTLAYFLGGWTGIGLFVMQAIVAIWQLELVNYVEHYGLTRKHLGDGKYEHVKPQHSWNADHRATNWLMINLQRHSDHHYKPDRRFPVLQTYPNAQAPQLPYGYPLTTMTALVPPLWRRVMNPKIRRWRETYYPEVTDWSAYNTATNPMPR